MTELIAKIEDRMFGNLARRSFLQTAFNGIGALAATHLLAGKMAFGSSAHDPFAVREQHLPRKAKHCIFLFMQGGVSQA